MQYVVLVRFRRMETQIRELHSEKEAAKWADMFPQDIVMAVEPEPDYKSILQMYMFHIFNHTETLYLHPGDRQSALVPNVLDDQAWSELLVLKKNVDRWANPCPAYFVLYKGENKVLMLPNWDEENAALLAQAHPRHIVFEADLNDVA